MVGIFQKAILAWRRFPLALLLAVITAASLSGAEWFRFHISDTKEWGHLLASWTLMAFCWAVCGHLWAERLPRLWQRLLVPVLVVAVTALVWGLGYAEDDTPHRWDSSMVVGMIGLLFLLVLPLLTSADGRDLRTRRWLYGLAKAILLSFLVALVVFIGLGIQLYLLEVLFDDYLRGYVFHLMILCQTVFAPWCALALAPSLWRAEETVLPPALAVKVVVQYVLGGLLALYCVTLNLYCLYVLVSWQWPEGAIAGLVVALAAVGGLVWTLVYAVRDDVPSRLERLVLVGFWPGLLAPVVALFVASTLRIEQYGITEPRYYLLLGGGLTLLGGVLQLTRRRVPSPSLLVVPVILVLLLSLYGPWSAETVAVNSQFQRLEATLSRIGWLESDGKINDFTAIAASPEDRKVIENTTRFLMQRGGEERLLSLLHHPERYTPHTDKGDYYGRTAAFMNLLPGLGKSTRVPSYDLVLLRDDTPLSVRGYDAMFADSLKEGRSYGSSISLQGKVLRLELPGQAQIRIYLDDEPVTVFDLTPMVMAYLKSHDNCLKCSCTLSPPLEFNHVMGDGTVLHLLVTGLRGTYIPDASGPDASGPDASGPDADAAIPDSGKGRWHDVEPVDFVLLLKEGS